MIRFRAPMPYDAYCRRFRLNPEDPASLARYRAYYIKFTGD